MQAGDTFRVIAFLLLYPAATYLPRSWAMGLADAAGAFFAMSPIGARVRRSMRTTFPSAGDTGKIAREWLGRPFRDYVIVRRLVARREIAVRWSIESRDAPAILREPNQSVIVATGHFSRQAMTGVYMPKFIPKKLAAVIAPLDRHAHNARGLRLRLQLGEMMNAIRRVRDDDVDVVEVGGAGVVTRLLKHLKQPGGVVVIATDAATTNRRAGGFERPFAGHASQSFALGTARLSRLSQCPIVTCVPFLDDDDNVVLEWGEAIPAPADPDADARVTSAILDRFERAIGRRPGQYVLPIGEERQWRGPVEGWTTPPNQLPVAPAPAASAPVTASAPERTAPLI